MSLQSFLTPMRRLIHRSGKSPVVIPQPAPKPAPANLLRRNPADGTVIYPGTFISCGYANSEYDVFVKPTSNGKPHQVQVLRIQKTDKFEMYEALCFIPAIGKVKTLPISYSQPLEVKL